MKKKILSLAFLILLITKFSLVFGSLRYESTPILQDKDSRELLEYRWMWGELNPQLIRDLFAENPNLQSFILSRNYNGYYNKGQKFVSPKSNKYDDAGECIEALAECLINNKKFKKLSIKIHGIDNDMIWLKLFESLKSSDIKDLTLDIGSFYSNKNRLKIWSTFFKILQELRLKTLDLYDTNLDFLIMNETSSYDIRKEFIKYLKSDNCSIEDIYFPSLQRLQSSSFLDSFLEKGYKSEILIENLKPTIHTENRYDKCEQRSEFINQQVISTLTRDVLW